MIETLRFVAKFNQNDFFSAWKKRDRVEHMPRTSDLSGGLSSAHRRVDERGDDNQDALEEILVSLCKPQEGHGIENLGEQDGAKYRSDEGPAPAR
jgi:hypothetical protein